MLKYLEIRNFVLIDKLKINFNNGFNVLTGETGAGKSIIISALELITGEKGSIRMVGSNGDRLIVMGCFSLQSSSNIVKSKLKEWNIEINNNELNIKREITKDGKSKSFINNVGVRIAELKELGDLIVDIHGQHEHQSLFNPSNHLNFYDSFLNIEDKLEIYKEHYNKLTKLIKQYNEISQNKNNILKEKSFLEYAIDEIEKANDLTFVGCSKWITDCASRSVLTKRFSCINIPNPIDTSVFYEEDREKTRKKLGAKEGEKIIVFGAMTADSDERKGYRYLLEALNELSKLEQNYRAVVFGNKGELHFDGLNIPVTGLGMIHDDNKLRKIYSAADVFVAPSVQENLSNAVMESLSCSTPVAAFNIGGMSDMIDHKETGYLAKPFDAADLAAGIAYSAAHPQMRQNARRKVEESFGMSVVGKQYKALYQKKNNR